MPLLKIPLAFLFLFLFAAAYSQTEKIKQADSLFRVKQYTQSLEVYQAALSDKNYSLSMLLKMAYISEGLGKIGPTLYYLKLYGLATDDEQVLRKAEELATKYKLSGYGIETNRLQHWFEKNVLFFQVALALVLLGLAAFQAQKMNRKSWVSVIAIVIVSTVVLFVNNYSFSSVSIVTNYRTYLMEGPSAGAAVVGIVGEGNLLQTLGRQDVWLQVQWMDKIVYVKEDAVLNVAL